MGWGLVIATLFVVSCAPVISDKTMREVSPNVRLDTLLPEPAHYVGVTVLLGGEIIETQPLPGKTVIMVLERSLGWKGRPEPDGSSSGRFIVWASGFLDPAIYRPGRLITVAGRVTGKEERPLGKIRYTYPVIEKKELYLWPVEAQSPGPRFRLGIGVGKTF